MGQNGEQSLCWWLLSSLKGGIHRQISFTRRKERNDQPRKAAKKERPELGRPGAFSIYSDGKLEKNAPKDLHLEQSYTSNDKQTIKQNIQRGGNHRPYYRFQGIEGNQERVSTQNRVVPKIPSTRLENPTKRKGKKLQRNRKQGCKQK